MPLFKRLNVDAELALLAIRLRQGDFYIIEDKAQYLQAMLPTPEIRKLTMGLCGILTCPIKFRRVLGNYPVKHRYNVTFEGALEMLSDILGINPIVARLVAFDPNAYEYVQTQHDFPKSAVSARVEVIYGFL